MFIKIKKRLKIHKNVFKNHQNVFKNHQNVLKLEKRFEKS